MTAQRSQVEHEGVTSDVEYLEADDPVRISSSETDVQASVEIVRDGDDVSGQKASRHALGSNGETQDSAGLESSAIVAAYGHSVRMDSADAAVNAAMSHVSRAVNQDRERAQRVRDAKEGLGSAFGDLGE